MLTRPVHAQLALRYVFTDQLVERMWELLGMIAQIEDQSEATRILHTLLRYCALDKPRLKEPTVRALVHELANGEALMQSCLDRYTQQGEATLLLNMIEYKFGPLSEAVHQGVEEADPETLIEWSRRLIDADNLDAVLH